MPSEGKQPRPRKPRRSVTEIRGAALNIDYRCDECHLPKRRQELFVKRVQWTTMGKRANIVRSRVMGWVCKTCMEADADYNRKSRAASRGYAHTELARQLIMEMPDPDDEEG